MRRKIRNIKFHQLERRRWAAQKHLKTCKRAFWRLKLEGGERKAGNTVKTTEEKEEEEDKEEARAKKRRRPRRRRRRKRRMR